MFFLGVFLFVCLCLPEVQPGLSHLALEFIEEIAEYENDIVTVAGYYLNLPTSEGPTATLHSLALSTGLVLILMCGFP